MPLLSAIPILRMFATDRTYEFYLTYLGFELDWEHRFADDMPLYAQIRRDSVILHLSEHHGDSTPGSAVFLPIDDVEALHRELQGKSYTFARPGIEDAGWGREMLITDPAGNRLRFCQLT